MLSLPGDIDEYCFGGMFRELVGLTDVHLTASAAQTVQQERLHLHVAHQVEDRSDLRLAIQYPGNALLLLGGFRAALVFERDLSGFLPASERHDRVVILGIAKVR